MAEKTTDRTSGLIDQIREGIRQRLSGMEEVRCERFVSQFYEWVPPEDLEERSPEDLVGAALSQWRLAQRRGPDEACLRVYNPEPERDGWYSPHTVVEIVSEDMPFLVDSVTMELNRRSFEMELVIHPVMRLRRDSGGQLIDVFPVGDPRDDAQRESVMHLELIRVHDPAELEQLTEGLRRVLGEVRMVVADWRAMLAKLEEAHESLTAVPPASLPNGGRGGEGQRDPVEAGRFLEWLGEDHFTFLGYREYDFHHAEDGSWLQARPDSGLGILRHLSGEGRTELSGMALRLAQAPQLLVLTKANSRSTVHRPAYLDYVGVKVLDESGAVRGERRFLGLYSTDVYKESALEIPLVRRKVQEVIARAAFPSDSHDAKALLDVLETYPRDALLQMDADDLFTVATGIVILGQRQRVRLFINRDPLDRFAECLVCLPRDRFNSEIRERIAAILLDAFDGQQLDWSVQISDSVIARVHYVVRCASGIPEALDEVGLERRVTAATRAWGDELRAALIERHGEERGVKLHLRYSASFPPAYRSDWAPGAAVQDIDELEALGSDQGMIVRLRGTAQSAQRQAASEPQSELMRCKLFTDRDVSLSDVVPVFEHMGLQVVEERPHRILPADGGRAWIYDFGLRCDAEPAEEARDLFQTAFLAVMGQELEDDRLNALVLEAGLTVPQVGLIRAVTRYLRQGGIPFSDTYLRRTLAAHPEVARLLVELFEARFDPRARDAERVARARDELRRRIDDVQSLDEDRILRSYLAVMTSALRTNYFTDREGPDRCLSLKLDPRQIPFLPLPRPRFEIFVHSPRVEGVHLRGGRVARGGLRWSDRPEDFRTEVLGLMKAQMVKNALIVPVGSKGGFVVKRPPAAGDRDAMREEAVACYESFLSGMLQVTDNIAEGRVVPPDAVVRYDEDDPYLVVAADKGTATFSDIANRVSLRHGFWLGDAFASGGSHGYDHKAIGITARGAWESVKRHFRERGRDLGRSDFTVVGIGDMSGDVFGNGMLLSRHIRLVAAFNHEHIFIDPQPDPELSFRERERLFRLERSGWGDYDRSRLSEGGGVWERSAKTVELSARAREALGVEQERLSPPELISAILRAPVDLLWNGGIGTYVKATVESHSDVGDKANDAVRINAPELRCQVVGEGGNLGFTQLARVQFAARGGSINTDAIDNAAGVNCSDHEVNIKILLDAMVAAGEMSFEQRNTLLSDMTEAVAERVIYASYTQSQALSLARAQAPAMNDVHARLIRWLEQHAGLDRALEFLPDDAEIERRRSEHEGLWTPELAVVMAYCKIHLYSELLESDLPEDEHLGHDLERYFPPPLGPPGQPVDGGTGKAQGSPPQAALDRAMHAHRLRREIIATVVSNQLVDRAGMSFVFRLAEETGAPPARLARAYAAAREIFDMRSYWTEVEALDNRVDASVQLDLLIEARRLVERSTRWLAVTHPRGIDIGQTVARFQDGAALLRDALPEALQGIDREAYEALRHELAEVGVPRSLAGLAAAMPSLPPLFDIVELAEDSGCQTGGVIDAYYLLGARLELDWLRERVLELPRANRWQTLARAALRDDVTAVHRSLVGQALEARRSRDPGEAVEAWERAHAGEMERWRQILADIKASHSFDTTTLPVALREARNLIHGSGRAAAAG